MLGIQQALAVVTEASSLLLIGVGGEAFPGIENLVCSLLSRKLSSFDK